MIDIVNLTPHAVSVIVDGEVLATFAPAGPVARVREIHGAESMVETDRGAVPVVGLRYDTVVEGLPAPASGVVYLVSRVTAAAVHRRDLVFPQGELRDQHGQIIGCQALGFFDVEARDA